MVDLEFGFGEMAAILLSGRWGVACNARTEGNGNGPADGNPDGSAGLSKITIPRI